jgi:hypothetical protein
MCFQDPLGSLGHTRQNDRFWRPALLRLRSPATAAQPPVCAGAHPVGLGRAPTAAVPWRDPDSPLSWFQRMLDRLRECAEVGVGDHEVIDVGLPQVLVHRASTRGSVLFAHDLADR